MLNVPAYASSRVWKWGVHVCFSCCTVDIGKISSAALTPRSTLGRRLSNLVTRPGTPAHTRITTDHRDDGNGTR